KRHNFYKIKLHDESSSANIVAINLSLSDIICTTNCYYLCDIYNMDKTEVLLLPKNTISKIQPIDASIITSFKLYYYHLQLQHTIDHDEAREQDIYK
ncbi:4583_t:CDS:2, partial [Dentiscutata heterogama]